MASTYSTNLAIELIGTGEQSGTWGVTTNTNLGTLLEQAISGYVTQAITDGSGANTTITIPNGATGVARNMFIEMTGALTFSTTNLIVPANKKLYFIYNNTTGGYAVTVKVSGQTGVSVPNGKKVILVSNGTDIVNAENYIASLSVGALTSGRVPYAGTSGLLQDSANLTFNGTTLTANTIGAYTLSGTVAGGGNQINNVIIGTSTPLAGSFTSITGTSITDSGLTSGRVTFASTGGLLADSANLLWDGTTFGVTGRLYNGSASTFGASSWGMSLGNGGASANYFKANDTYWQNAAGTQTMTLDSSGNLGIGTSTPYTKLQVTGTIKVATGNAQGILSLGDGNGAAVNCGVYRGAAVAPTTDGNYLNLGGYDGIVFATGNAVIASQTERMRIDSSGNLSIGTTATNGRLSIQGSGSYNSTGWGVASDLSVRSTEMTDSAYHSILQLVSIRQSLSTGSGANGFLGFSTIDDSNNTGINDALRIAAVNETGNSNTSAVAMSFWTNSGGSAGNAPTEKMRIDSSGSLLIGFTSSPSSTYKFYSVDNVNVYTANDASGTTTLRLGSSTSMPQGIANIAGIKTAVGSGVMTFNTGNSGVVSEVARIDSSGNVGINKTPSAWGSTLRALQFNSGSYISDTGGGSMAMVYGIYNNGTNWIYATTGVAVSYYAQEFGVHQWFKGASGTSGGTATLTESMRIDSSGNLGIGTSSPAAKLHVSGSFGSQFRLQETGGTYFDIAVGGRFDLKNAAGTTIVSIAQSGSPVGTQLNIDTSGNLGLGSVIPAAWISSTLQIEYGAFHSHYYGTSNNQTLMMNNSYVSSDTNFRYIYTGASLSYVMNNGAGWFWNQAGSGTAGAVISYTTRMNLTDTGILLVGTTQSNPYSGFEINPNGGASFQTIGHLTGTSSGTAYMNFNYNQSGCGSITQNGTSAVLYNITSDYRLKEVIGSVTGAGERIDALQPIDYLMKADGSQHRGFLAHKFQEVYPNSVAGEKDAVDANGKPVHQQMQAGTAEVIADLVAEIQSLRARVAQLETKGV
jgi:hypothetical protein